MPDITSALPPPTYSSFLAELNQRADVSGVIAECSKKPLKLYLNSARLLYRTAELYHRTGDLSNAYVLYLKFSNLLVYTFPKHRQYRQHPQEIVELKKSAVLAIDALERIKEGLEVWWEEQVRPVISVDREDVVDDDRIGSEQQQVDDQITVDESERRRIEIERFHRKQSEDGADPYGLLTEQFTKITVDECDGDNRPTTFIDKLEPEQEQKHEHKIVEKMIFLTESGMPLRLVTVPVCIVEVFMKIAAANTDKNVETCGVLGGTLHQNTFKVTHLIIPKQHGTSDTVSMIKEEEVAEVAIRSDLMTLGWIHTHPTQSCFMSSVDQHTQFPFQALMAEAVAIVVAPRRQPNYGVFRLTDPPGMASVGRCGLAGFHAHPDNMYRELVHSSPTGHVRMDGEASLSVIDLR
jgi:STAM-binding protein